MKITLCTRRFRPPFVGGVDVYTARLGLALQRAGHEISFLAVDSTADNRQDEITVSADEYQGMAIWRIHFAFARRPKQWFDLAYDPDVGQAIESILAEEKPDIFIILNFYTITLAAVEAAKTLGIPVVHVATDFLPVCRRATLIRWDGRPCQKGESIKSCAECFVSQRVLGRVAASALNHVSEETLRYHAAGNYRLPHPLALFKPYWQQVTLMEQRLSLLSTLRQQIDLVLAPTWYTRKMFLDNGFAPEQVQLLPFGVESDHPLSRVKHIPAPYTRFLFVGRLQPYKGAHLLLEAFNSLKSPKGATLTIYGAADGYDDYYQHLQRLIVANERIHFGGTIAPEALGQAFATADFFVLPSTWHENSPLILLDALQSQTPVIASAIGGVTDLVADGVNGYLFPAGDQQALRRVMQRAIDQPEVVEQLRPPTSLPTIDQYTQTLIQLCKVGCLPDQQLT